MITKHIPMKSARRSSFCELVAYITHAKDKAVRIGEVRVTNCHQQDAQDAMLEVLATQLQNQRACSDKTYHLLISFPAGDSPSAEALRSIEDEVCNALGFGEHQRVSAVHTDTDSAPTACSLSEEAARRYIAEREMKPSLNMRYAGWRRVDGQFLLLAQTSTDKIAVIPVEAEVIARMSGCKRGEVIALDKESASIRRRHGLGGLGELGETKGMRR